MGKMNFDMSSMLSDLKVVAQNTISDNIKMININELHESEDNFFDVNRVEELAESILGQGGVKENLIVTPLKNGGYEIISGHRRKAAVQYLIDKGENISPNLPCLIQNYEDSNTKKLELILMNISQRVLTDNEMMLSFEKLDKILKEKRALGEKLGKTRERIAEMLNVSPTQVRKMQNIETNAIPEVVDAVKNGNITINTADKIASLEKDEQKEIIADNSEPITPKKVEITAKKKKNEKEGVISDTLLLSDVPESLIKKCLIGAAENAHFDQKQINRLIDGLMVFLKK